MQIRAESRGAEGARKALSRWGRELPRRVADEATGDAAERIRREAVQRLRGRAGGGSYPRRNHMIKTRRGNRSNAVTIGGTAWAKAAELGTGYVWVFGRRFRAPLSTGFRQFAPHRRGSGWLVGAVLERRDRAIGDELADAGIRRLKQLHNQYGVPRA